MPGIVVGVDGSSHSQNALNWAIAESALRHTSLTVLAVSPIASDIWGLSGQHYASDEDARAKIKQATQEIVDKAVAAAGDKPTGAVTVMAVSGLPADELIKASQDADMLVVGARGAGGFAKLAVGSVSSQVAHHALCPIVIVPGNQR